MRGGAGRGVEWGRGRGLLISHNETTSVSPSLNTHTHRHTHTRTHTRTTVENNNNRARKQEIEKQTYQTQTRLTQRSSTCVYEVCGWVWNVPGRTLIANTVGREIKSCVVNRGKTRVL